MLYTKQPKTHSHNQNNKETDSGVESVSLFYDYPTAALRWLRVSTNRKEGLTMAKKPGTHKPGTSVPDSGIVRNPQTGDHATVVREEPMPPTRGPGQGWDYVRRT